MLAIKLIEWFLTRHLSKMLWSFWKAKLRHEEINSTMSVKTIPPEAWTAVAALWPRFPNVLAAWLFGSAQTGAVRAGGDIDIAVWFAHQPDLAELAVLRAALQDAFQFDALDLVILNNASPITRFEAVSGKLLFWRDRGQMAGFVSLVAREYEDALALANRGLAWRSQA